MRSSMKGKKWSDFTEYMEVPLTRGQKAYLRYAAYEFRRISIGAFVEFKLFMLLERDPSITERYKEKEQAAQFWSDRLKAAKAETQRGKVAEKRKQMKENILQWGKDKARKRLIKRGLLLA